MKFLLVRNQGGGCDYTIGCGVAVEEIEAENMEAAWVLLHEDTFKGVFPQPSGGLACGDVVRCSHGLGYVGDPGEYSPRSTSSMRLRVTLPHRDEWVAYPLVKKATPEESEAHRAAYDFTPRCQEPGDEWRLDGDYERVTLYEIAAERDVPTDEWRATLEAAVEAEKAAEAEIKERAELDRLRAKYA